MVRVAIVGHRNLGHARASAFVADASYDVLSAAQRRWQQVAAVSALAEGADTFFAEVAMAAACWTASAVPPGPRWWSSCPRGASCSARRPP